MIKKIEIFIAAPNSIQRSWVDITEDVEQGLNIVDTADGTLDSGRFTALFNPEETIFDCTEAIPPRTPVRISEYELASIIPAVQFILQTADTTSVPLRFEETDDKGHVHALYTHTFNLVELTKELEGKYPPNFTVTQPKRIYNNAFRRDVTLLYNLPTRDKSLQSFLEYETFDAPTTVNTTRNFNNSSGVISYAGNKILFTSLYDAENKPIGGPSVEGYSIVMKLKLTANAPQVVNSPIGFGLIDDLRFVYPTRSGTLLNHLPFKIKMIAKYYSAGNVLLDTRVQEQVVKYYSNEDVTKIEAFGPVPMKGSDDPNFVPIDTSSISFYVPKNFSADYVEIQFMWKPDLGPISGSNRSLYMDNPGTGYGQHVGKDLINLYIFGAQPPLNTQLVTRVHSYTNNIPPQVLYYWPIVNVYAFETNIVSSVVTDVELDRYSTALDIVQKALDEINLKQRYKYVLSRRLSQLLSEIVSPETTLEEYNLKDLLYKYGRIANIIPILGDPSLLDENEDPLVTISYVKPGEHKYGFSVSDLEYIDKENEVVLNDFYSTAAARVHNAISERNYHTETVAMQAKTEQFSQLTQETMAFLASVPIYWLRRIVIKGFSITATHTGGSLTIKGNNPELAPDHVNQSWDFTDRCLEEDIWNALPDVNYATAIGREEGKLSKGSTISYKSGQRHIGNLGHMSPSIPLYEFPYTTAEEVANLAIVEAAAVLAYQMWGSVYENFAIPAQINVSLSTQALRDSIAEITFTPLDDFLYRHTTDENRRRNVDIEHRVNTQDRVVSLQDAAEMIIAEQNKKGHQVIAETLIHPNIAACYKTGWKTKNGYVITTRSITVFNEYVQCAYTLAKNFIIQNDHVGLDIKYERYAIPYESVMREVLNYTHIMISQNPADVILYDTDSGRNTATDFISMVLGWQSAPDVIYGKALLQYFVKANGIPIQSDRTAMFKLHKLNDRRVMMYIGRWVDNYSAGNQIYEATNAWYSQPYRYCDSNGKVERIRYDVYKQASFEPRKYPSDPNASYTAWLTGSESLTFESGDRKDAREAYEFNLTASIEDASDNKILLFSTFGHVTHLGVLPRSMNDITYSTKFDDLRIAKEISNITLVEASIGYGMRTYQIKIPRAELSGYLSYPIALYYKVESIKPELKFIFLEPEYQATTDDYILTLYVAPTRYSFASYNPPTSNKYIEEVRGVLTIQDSVRITKSTDYGESVASEITIENAATVSQFIFPIADFSQVLTVENVATVVAFEFPINDLALELTVTDQVTITAFEFVNTQLENSMAIVDQAVVTMFEFPINDFMTELTIQDGATTTFLENVIQDFSQVLTIQNSAVVTAFEFPIQDGDATLTIQNSATITKFEYPLPMDITTALTIQNSATVTIQQNQLTKSWSYIGTSATADLNVNWNIGGYVCPPISSVTSWLEAAYPAENYGVGYIIGVSRTLIDTFCAPLRYYYQVVET